MGKWGVPAAFAVVAVALRFAHPSEDISAGILTLAQAISVWFLALSVQIARKENR